jgi:hypothetical protein
MYREQAVTIEIPPQFTFKRHDVYDFEPVLRTFDWTLADRPVKIDMSRCASANYQALALLVMYAMKLRANRCTVSFEFGARPTGVREMWKKMGALGAFNVMVDEAVNFHGDPFKPLVGIRNVGDFKLALDRADGYCDGFNISYSSTLRYVLSELLYNTLEHGVSYFSYGGNNRRLPSILQFTWYETRHEMHFIIADCGIGIKRHLEQTYPAFESDADALAKAMEPGVSGTFGITDPYRAKNNQGVGLYISSNIVQRLDADMHIVSSSGVLHVSPKDFTVRTIDSRWPGTFVLVSIKVEPTVAFALESLMQELRLRADQEIANKSAAEAAGEFYLSISNHFGARAEDKELAARIRDRYILPAIEAQKVVTLDFEAVTAAPHSLLGALLATPIKKLGMSAYKRIKFINCLPEIRETIDFILNDNT